MIFGYSMRAVAGLPDIRNYSVKQQDEPRYRVGIYRRESPEEVVVGSITERNDILHDPQRSPLRNPGIPGGGGEINEEDEGDLDFKDLSRGGTPEPKESNTKIGQQATQEKEEKAEKTNEDEIPSAMPEISAQVTLVDVE